MFEKWRPCAVGALSLVFLGACQTLPTYRVHHTVLEGTRASEPERVLLVPAEVVIGEITAGGVVEEMPERSEAARNTLQAAIDNLAAESSMFELVSMPALSPDEQEKVDEHVALFDAVAVTAFAYPNPQMSSPDQKAWRHKVERFDLTLGSGLAFLADRTGADAALFVVGNSVVPTAGRKTAAFFAAMLGGAGATGYSSVLVGLVDCRSGDLLWINGEASVGQVFVSQEHLDDVGDAEDMLRDLFDEYPGIEEYRESL